MLTKSDLINLSRTRIEDAIILYRAGKSSSAYYLAGYSIELSIKVCISGLFQSGVIPDKALVNSIYTHNIDNLINVSGLRLELENELSVDSHFAAYWGITSKWSEQSRYQINDQATAQNLIVAITDSNHGAYKWLQQHW